MERGREAERRDGEKDEKEEGRNGGYLPRVFLHFVFSNVKHCFMHML